MLGSCQTHISGSQKSLKSFIALVPMLLMINIGRKSARLSCCYYVSVKIKFKYFPTICPFSEPEPVVFDGSGSGSDQNVSAPATPASAPSPAPHPWY